jgi:hypothetical protein
VLALITGWQVVTTVRFAHFVERYDTSNGGYGMPVRSALTVAQMARESLCRQPDCVAPVDVIAVAPGGDPLVNEQATILRVVLADVPHRFANSDAGLILRPDAAQYIFAPGAERALQMLLQNVEPGNVVTRAVPIRLDGGGAYTYVRVAEPVAHNYVTVEPAHWANGVTLLGYRTRLDEALHLEVLLHVDQLPAGQAAMPVDYHWFNHVLAGDQKVAQLDGGGIHPSNWRAGDVLLHWFDIALPQSVPQPPYVVQVGSYEYPAIQNVPVTLADGQISDGVSLPVGIP